MKKAFLISLFLFSKIGFAQIGLLKQYHLNYLAINPALAGENSPFTLKGILGNQFNGSIRFNQVNQVLVLDGQLYNKSGLAFQGYRNNSGNIISTGLGFSYAKGYEIGELKLKMGANAGIFIQPNNASANLSQSVLPHGGLGVFSSYKGVFLGVSNPMLLASKQIGEQKPILVNAGYIFDNESIFGFNANVLYYYDIQSTRKSYDFNLKASVNNRLGIGASYRSNNLMAYGESKATLIPFAEYKATKTMSFALSYDSKPTMESNPNTPNLPVGGVFQFMLKYNSDDSGGDSWFFGKF
ncbi:MAG: type IX secretion system membrane protein PorP/SprF [Leadbetterella sp.]|nr:type IX secretion system membrane protein PorP/SprF [Leadbetterella sp.]